MGSDLHGGPLHSSRGLELGGRRPPLARVIRACGSIEATNTGVNYLTILLRRKTRPYEATGQHVYGPEQPLQIIPLTASLRTTLPHPVRRLSLGETCVCVMWYLGMAGGRLRRRRVASAPPPPCPASTPPPHPHGPQHPPACKQSHHHVSTKRYGREHGIEEARWPSLPSP